jgi:hypothetical protein
MTTYYRHRVHDPRFYAVYVQEPEGWKLDNGVDMLAETAGAIPDSVMSELEEIPEKEAVAQWSSNRWRSAPPDSPRSLPERTRFLGLGSNAVVTVGAVMIVLCVYELLACLSIGMSTREGDSLLGYGVAAGLFGLLFGLLGVCAVKIGWGRAARQGGAERQSGRSLSRRSRVPILLGAGAVLAVGAVIVVRGIYGLCEFLYEVAGAYSRRSASGISPHLQVLLGMCVVVVGVGLPHAWGVLQGKQGSEAAHKPHPAVAIPGGQSLTRSQHRQVEQAPRFRFGLASFVLSLVPPALFLVFFALVLVLVAVSGDVRAQIGRDGAMVFMGIFLFYGGAVTAVVAVVAALLGITGLGQKQRNRPFAIIGTVLSGGWIVLAVILLSVIAGRVAD